ncbi:hypothetical protein RSAG8_10756, partial [Rhizoctonia solani AG-8 WAC10335]
MRLIDAIPATPHTHLRPAMRYDKLFSSSAIALRLGPPPSHQLAIRATITTSSLPIPVVRALSPRVHHVGGKGLVSTTQVAL